MTFFNSPTSLKIMTINAKALFTFCPKRSDELDKLYRFDMTRKQLVTSVVKQVEMMDTCPLFDQLLMVREENGEVIYEIDDLGQNIALYRHLVMMDFDQIFLSGMGKKEESKAGKMLAAAKDLIEHGFVIHFPDQDVHLVAFDKSGNMTRNGRISFIDSKYIQKMNERLNLGMDFSKIPVILSKFYAYRGLYLSSSVRVNHEKLKLDAESIVVMKDVRTHTMKWGTNKGMEKPLIGLSYEKNVPVVTADQDPDAPDHWRFTETKIKDYQYNQLPFDGEGFVVPEYSSYMNEALEMKGATSYQIRLPFVKGMLHEVDVQAFIKDFSDGGYDEKTGAYWYEDAFGIQRDLTKAKIFLTESMFKGKKWLEAHCAMLANASMDPMQIYCEALAKYHHGLYVSGTNLPYGHSSYTHLSYQMINTLDFTKEQFDRIVDKHGQLIDEPLQFIKRNETDAAASVWKKAILTNEAFLNDSYIKEQLRNTQKGLLNKLAMGKIVVAGQTRYLSRDLLPLLASLLVYSPDIRRFWVRYLNWSRFFLPVGTVEVKDEKTEQTRYIDASDVYGLDYDKSYAFFRSPHLSRNEQCLLKPMVRTDAAIYQKADHPKNASYKNYTYYLNDIYTKYFGHLTGIVMVSRSSVAPLCLGGADFDGDLVNLIFDQDVAEAVKTGVYEREIISEEGRIVNELKRKLPVIVIPSTESAKEPVPEHVPYQHIENTFSNRIGQISNAAIAIGQKEYDRRNQKNQVQDEKGATCEKCTLLTGLEIDAAKNGAHPNLDEILGEEISTCDYLDFKNQFRQLRAEPAFKFSQMQVKKISPKDGKAGSEAICVTAKDCKTKIEFPVTSTGTYINDLPVLFNEYFSHYQSKKVIKKVDVKDIFEYDRTEMQGYQKEIQTFRESCDAVINLYSFYIRRFLPVIKNEKNRAENSHVDDNTEWMIHRLYDDQAAERVLKDILPPLKQKIADSISESLTVKEMHQRMNTCHWQFQPMDQRKEALEQIFGEGFSANDLTEEERTLLCHFKGKGYKFLWLLIDGLERKTPFRVLKERIVQKAFKEDNADKYFKAATAKLNQHLEAEIKIFYNQNTVGIDERIYQLCLNEIRERIQELEKLDLKWKIIALYQETSDSSMRRRFFWDAFSWKDLQDMMIRKEVNGDAE